MATNLELALLEKAAAVPGSSLPTGWEEVNRAPANSTGYDAVAYYHAGNNELVIANGEELGTDLFFAG